ncbi:MAG: 3-dehydroquinate synthase [Bacteroidetes bacterium]|nr:MAG: 3-dehydroquinate synthase [Bacteroidota bacterium]
MILSPPPPHIGKLYESDLKVLLETDYAESQKVILVDELTQEHCLPYLLENFTALSRAEIIVIPVGEESKSLEIAAQIWQSLSEYHISRHDLLINLGGGVVTDLGGFIASVYKRGIDFINIPTSLLGMVDAAIGGKTGIDLGPYKNQLGMFAHAKRTYVDPAFLNTLADDEFLSGMAEMWKHAMIGDPENWNELLSITEKEELEAKIIERSLLIKHKIVEEDPFEKGPRKQLNLGHTIGHALEGLSLQNGRPLKHGYAVALGILCESHIAFQRKMLQQEAYDQIVEVLSNRYPSYELSEQERQTVLYLMRQDKKNKGQKILAVLPTGIGDCEIDQVLEEEDIIGSLKWLNEKLTL